MARVIGLMSGTSVDGIDAALVEITGEEFDLKIELLQAKTYPYPTALQSEILAVCAGDRRSMAEFAALDDAIAQVFAQAAIAIQTNQPAAESIGSHGQTIYHRPPGTAIDRGKIPGINPHVPLGYTTQLGRGALIAQLTGIPTVSNFRIADIAAGGQGAPLVTKVDACLISDEQKYRCIQNIGGIGNVTYLPPRNHAKINPENWLESIQGWDTGPGNSLINLAVEYLTGGEQTYDRNGAWAAQGTPQLDLVETWLKQPFFHQNPPKSTGRELFGVDYFNQCLVAAGDLAPADLLATITELTVMSIVRGYRQFLPVQPDEVFLCGGGSHNDYLRQRLAQELKLPVLTTDDLGLNADFKEAIAFAVLAYWRKIGVPGNIPTCTGARQPMLLGEINSIYRGFQITELL